MITRKEICSVCDEYVAAVSAHDTDALLRLFRPDATQEEPVGATPNVGHDQIRAFFASSEHFPFTVRRIGPITVNGQHAAFQIRVDLPLPDTPPMTSTDLLTFDDTGRIRAIVAIPDSDAHPDEW